MTQANEGKGIREISVIESPRQWMAPVEFRAMMSDVVGVAEELKRAILAQNLVVKFKAGGQEHEYPLFQAWQLVGQALGYTVKTGISELIPDGKGGTYAVKAWAQVLNRRGEVVGGAEQICAREGQQWVDKPVEQLAGMAQTRAGSRALQQVAGWVMKVVGYETTPGEEMAGEGDSDLLTTCPDHNAPWFKSGRMQAPGHKLADGSWCNQPTVFGGIVKATATSLGWEIPQLREWMHVEMGGAFSTLAPAKQVEAIGKLGQLLPVEALEDPALQDPKGSGS